MRFVHFSQILYLLFKSGLWMRIQMDPAVLRIRIRIINVLPDPVPHGQMRIRIQEVTKPRKSKSSLGEYRTGS